MPGNLRQTVESIALNGEEISGRTAQIHAIVLSKSKYIDNPNFTRIHTTDLELLFAEYDNEFFDGQIKETLGTMPLSFRLSKRMTSSGGKTACYADRSGIDGEPTTTLCSNPPLPGEIAFCLCLVAHRLVKIATRGVTSVGSSLIGPAKGG